MNVLDATSKTSVAGSPDPRSLACFFTAWRHLRAPNDERMSLFPLERFFASFHGLNPTLSPPHVPHEHSINPERLSTLFRQFRPALQEIRERGDFVQFWSIAGLGKNEVRNVSVLAWLLNPKQTHGYGPAVYHAFMKCLADRQGRGFIIPIEPSDSYTVVTEKYSLGDSQDRIDVMIEGKDSLIFIEAKIEAPEGYHQIDRYISTLEKRARHFKKAYFFMIYLTKEINPPKLDAYPSLIFASWKDVALAIETVTKNRRHENMKFTARLLNDFARHVAQL